MAAPEYIETSVAAALKASSDVSAICSGHVYPLKIPQGTVLPAVVYQRTYSAPHNTLQGYTSETVTLTVNCFSLTYAEAKALAIAVRKAMSLEPLNAIFDSERDLMNETGDVYCISAEYRCQQTGGYCYG